MKLISIGRPTIGVVKNEELGAVKVKDGIVESYCSVDGSRVFEKLTREDGSTRWYELVEG